MIFRSLQSDLLPMVRAQESNEIGVLISPRYFMQTTVSPIRSFQWPAILLGGNETHGFLGQQRF